jgi:formylglycine-generating enzyme required for sulfatase activity
MKSIMKAGLAIAWIASAFAPGTVSAQILSVDSVTVDSVWNTDSTNRVSRDCKISFIPRGEGTAKMSLTMSKDSGKTYSPSTDSMTVKNYALYVPLPAGQKTTITVRLKGGDRTGISFRMTARQDAPVIAGNPKIRVLGPTGPLTAGAGIQIPLSVRLNGDTMNLGYCAIAKVFWDTLGNGTNLDTTTGANAKTLAWQTKVPAGTTLQTRTVIAYALDKNGLKSDPETLSVQFGLHRYVVMKDIPAGTFQMGQTVLADTVHQVTLSAFAMQETPVTQELYVSVTGVNPSYSLGDLTRPVDNVTWFDAVLFCNALSKLSSLDTCYAYTAADASDAICDFTKKGYRLPTEAESEYACRGGMATTYWWGNDTTGIGARVYFPVYNSGTTTTSVASGLANAYGLYDVAGNGWKWCNDWFQQPYGSGAVTNPKGPVTGVSRALRGGAWVGSMFILQDYYKSANRGNLGPTSVMNYCGLCCAMTR